MQINRTIAGVVMALLLLLFAAGVIHLFLLRFDAGDVYPAYSSLRSDPLGTRALYESLENIDTVSVRRNYHQFKSVTFEPQTTFFYLGTSADEFNWVPEEMITVFDHLTQTGGRLVITFLPVTQKRERKADKEPANRKTKPKGEIDSKDKQSGDKKNPDAPSRQIPDGSKRDAQRLSKEREHTRPASIKKRWGIGMAFNEILPLEDKKHLAIEATTSHKDLPPRISWHTNLHFELFDDAWQTLYSYDGLPLIVERSYGKGSILVCADSYFVSNEALWSERHPQLLVWLMGGHSKVIFDEAHFGIFKQPSVAQFIRRYRFHWFFAALAVLALLYVWKNAAYFVPPSAGDDTNGAEVVSEKDYTQGLVALLRRNIANNQILQVCAGEWTQTFEKSIRMRSHSVERIKGLADSGPADLKTKKDPLTEYREISQLLSEDKRL